MSLRLQRMLGEGGMGQVFLAIREEGSWRTSDRSVIGGDSPPVSRGPGIGRPTFRRSCAVKVLRPELTAEPAAANAFLDEARVMGALHHPNVVRVFDVGRGLDAPAFELAPDAPYLVMEYVDGLSLSALLHELTSAGDVIPLSVGLELLRDVATGLHAAHLTDDIDGQPLALLHRDISPDNILVGFDGVPRLTDFGIAKALGRASATTRDLLKGKLAYMAPERLQLGDASISTDLWSLGVVLYETLTQTRLYGGEDGPRRAVSDPSPDLRTLVPEASAALVELVFRLLAKRPEKRPRDAGEVARALDEILAALGGPESELTRGYMAQFRAVSRTRVRR